MYAPILAANTGFGLSYISNPLPFLTFRERARIHKIPRYGPAWRPPRKTKGGSDTGALLDKRDAARRLESDEEATRKK